MPKASAQGIPLGPSGEPVAKTDTILIFGLRLLAGKFWPLDLYFIAERMIITF